MNDPRPGLDTLIVAVGRALAGEESSLCSESYLAAGELFASDVQPVLEPIFEEAYIVACERRIYTTSPRLLDLVLKLWMSEAEVLGLLVALAAAVRRRGSQILEDYSNPLVREAHRICARVDKEIMRLVGLARFSPRADGLYSATIEPDHNIVTALAPRFVPRFRAQDFAIVDLCREIACLWREGELRSIGGEAALALLPPKDDCVHELWRGYYRSIDNPSRRNEALQRRLMPTRYWKHLPELRRD